MTNVAANAAQEGCDLKSFFFPSQAEAPAGIEADLIDVGFTDDVKKGGHGGGGGGGFTAPLVGLDGLLPVPMPMPMPSTNPPFSYPPPKGLVSAFVFSRPFFSGEL